MSRNIPSFLSELKSAFIDSIIDKNKDRKQLWLETRTYDLNHQRSSPSCSTQSSERELYGNVSYVAPGPALDASEAALID